MNDNAVVDLDHQLILAEKTRRLFHQQRSGECHEIQRAPQQLIRVEGQEIVNGVCRGELIGPLRAVAAERLILPVILNLISDDVLVRILDGLTYNILAGHELLSPFWFSLLFFKSSSSTPIRCPISGLLSCSSAPTSLPL